MTQRILQRLAQFPIYRFKQRKSEQTSITCFNADRHGFLLARAKQAVF
jgi:uncharacterized protein YjhX (UPF0386 family)